MASKKKAAAAYDATLLAVPNRLRPLKVCLNCLTQHRSDYAEKHCMTCGEDGGGHLVTLDKVDLG